MHGVGGGVFPAWLKSRPERADPWEPRPIRANSDISFYQGPSPLREVHKITDTVLSGEFSGRRVFAVMKGWLRGVVSRGDYEEWSQEVYVAVTKGIFFAVTRVEQRAIEAVNVSLLALYKEGQSDSDPPPWTPIIHHPNSATGLESPTCNWGSDQRPLSGAASWSTPFPPTTRYKPNSDLQLVSLIGWRVE